MAESEGEARVARAVEQMGDLDGLLITAQANVRYLTSFTGSSGCVLLLGRRGAGGGAGTEGGGGQARCVFFTDFRYETQAEDEVGGTLPGCERVISGDGDLLAAAAAAIGDSGDKRVGFEEAEMSVARHRRFGELLGEGVELVGTAGIVEALREVKDGTEQRRIAEASALADDALRRVLEGGLVGRTEVELALEIETEMRRLGAEGASFPTIVASGPHGALPHAHPRAAEVWAGTLVCIDWGAVLDGYCSDGTRTFAAGEVDGHAREIYELVLEAQLAGVEAVSAGRTGVEVDAVARAVIEGAGLGERFGHGLGHGVGIEIHEGPRLARTAPDDKQLVVGNVVTVEPGVYLPGELGVRIEDLLVVESDGARNLSSLPKELTVVG